jgi:SAM-dependent methyltransferase
MRNDSMRKTQFDEYASSYDAALAQGLALSGEHKEYFARGRIKWLAGCLSQLKEQPITIIDFGCGIGTATPLLLDLIGAEHVLGLDTSAKSLEVAKRIYQSERVQFLQFKQYQPGGQIDLVFCNGVFHHIPLHQRASIVEYVYRALRPGGLFAFWENNPWNPGTRYVMSRIPFDHDAIPLTPIGARRLLRTGGFEIIRTNFLFIFPRILRWLRCFEPLVSGLPLGTQYQVLCRKPQ